MPKRHKRGMRLRSVLRREYYNCSEAGILKKEVGRRSRAEALFINLLQLDKQREPFTLDTLAPSMHCYVGSSNCYIFLLVKISNT